MNMAPLMQRAAQAVNQQPAGGPKFKRPTIPVSPKMRDTVDRIVAAGMKIMYSPEMADEREQAVSGGGPVAQALAESITGLTLILDQKSQGGIPIEAIFPSAMELLSDAAEMFIKAGKPVDQETYNDAARIMFVMIGKKLGASDDDLMQGAQQAAGGGQGGPDDESQEGESPQDEAAEGESQDQEAQEEQRTAQGLPEDPANDKENQP
jgi:hypothetical protein